MSYTPPGANAVDFDFAGSYTPPAAGAVDFDFGSDGEAPTSGETVDYGVRYGSRYGSTAALDRRARTAPWGLFRVVDATAVEAWAAAAHRAQRTAMGWDAMAPRSAEGVVPWGDVPQQPSGRTAVDWIGLFARDDTPGGAAPWGTPDPSDTPPRQQPWLYPPARDLLRGLRYRRAVEHPVVGDLAQVARYAPPAGHAVALATVGDYTPPPPDAIDLNTGAVPLTTSRAIQPAATGAAVGYRRGDPRDADTRIPWGFGLQPADPPPWEVPYPQEPPEPPPEPPPLPPELEVYVLMPSISATRVSDGAAINVNAASVTTDRDSFCWQLDATLARAEDLALVMPGSGGPVAIDLTINGRTWRFLVESYRRSRSYNSSSYQIRGRGQAATLTAPYATPATRTEGSQRTAQQLALDELEFTGWSLVWEAEDWIVPGGVHSYQELTPLQAIRRVAEAVGAVVHSDPTAQTLTVAPRYPVSPWQWSTATPDVILPDYLMTSLSLDWSPGPPYNAVYVAGRQQGVLVHTLRSGTSQDQEAPMVVDGLITERLAGRERGRQILAAAGDRARVPIVTPLLPDPEPPGLVLPGQLVEVQEDGTTWIGQAMGVTVDGRRQNAATVRQTVEVERWYG